MSDAEKTGDLLGEEWDLMQAGSPNSMRPTAVRDDCWDVFILDDETAEAEPQYGDFWDDLGQAATG